MTVPISKIITLYTLLILTSIIVFAPTIMAFIMSFMTNQDIMTGSLPKELSFDNYIKAFNQFPLFKYLFNSFVVAIVIMLGQLLLSSLAAYAFVFLEFKGRDFLFYIFIATMMVPFEASVIPNFHTIRDLGWIDTYQGLSVPFFAIAFGTFLLRQTFKQIPKELKEASEVAGIGDFKFYFTIVLPVAKTSLVTLGVYGFLTSWNMYLWPLLSTTNDKVRTVQIGLKQLQTQEQLNDWGVIMAGAIIVVIPTLIILFFGQNKLQRGLAESALK
ncbi:carbohydrate ABC transporter permease [Lederbergia wuyishanensis]|uniref:Sn-glycerol 3-phosphate transport system permease protein n=1 Tax=Lederbergia wuyishanensis TaxID=1347903 RepID=A0ABU0D9P0_9BACI|nr:carbohydrate ABC transporter permease [Lederbergia wuyishanensis]MCJ8007428.1 carbohydrate ABC transporter permease [Lederbergia wuyishanensis]MDQ0345134.1 sn-glycerol 3-phosphate transport system permease protein [Lederbergia wuyishanensis]